MNRNLLILLVGMSAWAGGCTMAPQYNRPQAPVPDRWPSGAAYESKGPTTQPANALELNWREFFLDPKLRQVVELSLRNNRDLRIAALNVERARAMYGIQRAELLPVFNAGAGFTRQRTPADFSLTGQPSTGNQFTADFGMSSWEIDFFGRIRSLVDRALEEYLATEEARRSTQILLVSEVANAYLTVAASRDTLKIAKTTLETQQFAYDLVKRRLDRGLVPELDLFRAQTQVDAALADVARYTQLSAQSENALNLLVGSAVPESLLPADLTAVQSLKEISSGVSSDVLLKRPDILQAEHQLKGTNASIGAARAAFFPCIALTTGVGLGSNELSDLFKSGSMAWNFAPQASVPIFDPRLFPALKATEVEQKAAVAQYEKAIQVAFREVADTLAVRGTINRQIAAQVSLVHAAQETYRLSSIRYLKGLDNYLSVLDAQQSLYSAQQRLVALRLEGITSQVKLYAVLGGGWQSSPETLAAK